MFAANENIDTPYVRRWFVKFIIFSFHREDFADAMAGFASCHS